MPIHDGVRRRHPQAAIFDIRLVNESVYPVADKLMDMGIPFSFASSEQRCDMLDRFHGAYRAPNPLISPAPRPIC